MKTRHLCGIFALGFAPCAMAVSITQTYVVNFANSGSSTGFAHASAPLLYFDHLTSITFVADIAANVTAVYGNMSSTGTPPVTFLEFVSLQSRFNLGGLDLPSGFPIDAHASGTTVTLVAEQRDYFSAALTQHYSTVLTSPDLEGRYFGPTALGFHGEYYGGNLETFTSGTATFSLTYVYAGPAAVPEYGSTGVLLAIACCGLFVVTHLRNQELRNVGRGRNAGLERSDC